MSASMQHSKYWVQQVWELLEQVRPSGAASGLSSTVCYLQS